MEDLITDLKSAIGSYHAGKTGIVEVFRTAATVGGVIMILDKHYGFSSETLVASRWHSRHRPVDERLAPWLLYESVPHWPSY